MPFTYEPTFQLHDDTTPYRKLTTDFVTEIDAAGRKLLTIAPEALKLLAKQAFSDVSFYLRPGHLQKLSEELKDPEASDNDRFVIYTHLQNAVVAAAGHLPSCQDTGTAIVSAKKGRHILTDFDDASALSEGVYDTYQQRNLRYSQIAALEMFKEKNTATNLPAEINLYADSDESHANEYNFLFIAKGGGSANKAYLYQQTPSVLNEKDLETFIRAKLKDLGTSACPPYHLAIVIGGTSVETTIEKPSSSPAAATTIRCPPPAPQTPAPSAINPGKNASSKSRKSRKSAPSSAANISPTTSAYHPPLPTRRQLPHRHRRLCSADRQIKGKITRDGVFLEQLETHPEKYLPEKAPELAPPVAINLNQGMDKVRAPSSQDSPSKPDCR